MRRRIFSTVIGQPAAGGGLPSSLVHLWDFSGYGSLPASVVDSIGGELAYPDGDLSRLTAVTDGFEQVASTNSYIRIPVAGLDCDPSGSSYTLMMSGSFSSSNFKYLVLQNDIAIQKRDTVYRITNTDTSVTDTTFVPNTPNSVFMRGDNEVWHYRGDNDTLTLSSSIAKTSFLDSELYLFGQVGQPRSVGGTLYGVALFDANLTEAEINSVATLLFP